MITSVIYKSLTEMDAKAELKKLALLIDIQVENYLKDELDHANSISPFLKTLIENSIEISKSGKRLRGAFLHKAYTMFGGDNLEEILKVTAFPEIIHSYLLIHDDIMDSADLRRGIPTIHKIYKDIHKATKLKSESLHFGEGIAICAGDILCHLGSRILTESNFNAENKIKALNIFHRKITDVGYGQVLDEYNEVKSKVTEEDILTVHLYKTAYYTYELPLLVGAILAGATDDQLKVLTKYSIPAGIAFQIQDDILGMFGSEEKTGKPVDSDLKEGKFTLLITESFKNANSKDKEFLQSVLGNTNITEADFKRAQQIIIDSVALEYSRQKAISLVTEAKKELEVGLKAFEQTEGYQFLVGIADYMIDREV